MFFSFNFDGLDNRGFVFVDEIRFESNFFFVYIFSRHFRVEDLRFRHVSKSKS